MNPVVEATPLFYDNLSLVIGPPFLGQFVDCINTLSSARQRNFKPFKDSPTGIKMVTPAKDGKPTVYESDRPTSPAACCGFYVAWAGLRPMTELELEKSVRGSRKPMPDEVAPSYWGIGGFNNWDWNAFKHDTQSERTVTVGNAVGRRFTGTHGLGTLTLPADWPRADAVGSGLRCTHYMPGIGQFEHNWNLQRPHLSDRFLVAVADPERSPSHKWRGVRTAPKEANTKPEKATSNDLLH